MAGSGFDFARGNLSKLLALPLYALGAAASAVVPRSTDRWVFGSGAGVAQGAWEFYQEVSRREPDARITWLVSNEAQAEQALQAGIPAVGVGTVVGFVATLRAGTAVVTHGLGDVNRYGSTGAFVVQLWHGIPLKRIHLDSPATLSLGGRAPRAVTALLRRMYRRSTRRIGLFPVPSALVGRRIASAFDLDPERIAVTGDPRDEGLLRGDERSRAARAHRVLDGAGVTGGADADRRLVLFAPTWRDGDVDPAVPSAAQAAALQALAEELDLLVIVRPHPLGVGAYRAAVAGHDRLRLADADTIADVNLLLPAVDALITDYSSVALDYSLVGSHVLWFAPDREEYERTRGLYEDYTELTGEHDTDWDAVIDRLRRLFTDRAAAELSAAATAALRERFFDTTEPGAPGRVHDAVLERRDAPARPGARRCGAGRIGATAVPAAGEPHAGADHAASGTGPVVFFESFHGRRGNDNPAGIDAAMARLRPEVQRVWGVASDEVAVPAGAHKVLEGSDAWFRARERADLFVVNDWLRTPVPHPRRQAVVQTWHGTPLKNLALGRPDVGLRTRLAILRQARRWDVLLSQNPYSSRRLATDYAFRGPVWELGYPRNDVLARGDRAAARAALGLGDQTRAVLYAPTWRDDGRVVLDAAGLGRVRARLGADTVLLVRAHSRVEGGLDLAAAGPGVIDVSELNALDTLLLAADVLVTDYSSLMFDAAVTRVPMVFHVPDLARYRDEDRGFGFDLESRAPGPLTSTEDELVAAVTAAHRWDPAHAAAYAAWVKDFVPLDDGGAGERVLTRLEETGLLRPPA